MGGKNDAKMGPKKPPPPITLKNDGSTTINEWVAKCTFYERGGGTGDNNGLQKLHSKEGAEKKPSLSEQSHGEGDWTGV